MKVLCVITPSHKELFDNFFIKTIPCPENIFLKTLEYKGTGNYKSNSWQNAVKAKIEFVISYIKSVDDSTFFVFSDVDVQFFRGFSLDKIRNELLISEKDILFQKENLWDDDYTVNSGFYIARTSEKILEFFESVYIELDRALQKTDQTFINKLLPGSNIEWGFLSDKYYARSHGFPPPLDIVCHHANYASNIQKKVYQMKLVRYYLNTNRVNRYILAQTLKNTYKFLRKAGLERLCI